MTKGDKVKEHILRKASKVFQRRGFRATSVNDLIVATGVKKGSLYFHFPGKRGLALAVLQKERDEFQQFLHESLTGSTPRERLEGFFDAALAKHRKKRFVGGCLWGNTALEMSDEDSQYARVVIEVFDMWTALIDTVIADGQKEGQIRSDLSSHVLAHQVIASIEGGIMLSRLSKTDIPFRACLDGLRIFLSAPSKRKRA
jgi:TetR/AcrR family transcriptional repressor of nem operon